MTEQFDLFPGPSPADGLASFNSRHWLYRRWSGMKDRCYNPKASGFEYYGGKGVTVAPEWLSDALAFARWSIANGASPELQIDRENGSGNYTPGNCRWVSRRDNLRNRPPKSEWNWSDASRTRYQKAIDDEEADLRQDADEWEALSVLAARRNYGRGMSSDELRTFWSAHSRDGVSYRLFSRRLLAGWRLNDAALLPPAPRDGRSHDWLYSRWLHMLSVSRGPSGIGDTYGIYARFSKPLPLIWTLWLPDAAASCDGFLNFKAWSASVRAPVNARFVRIDRAGHFTPENCRFIPLPQTVAK